MEKKNTGVRVAIVILSLLVVGLTSYIVYDKVLNKNNDKCVDNNNLDNVTENNQENNSNNDVQTNEYDLKINIDKLYKIKKSDYNFIKREYIDDKSFNLTTEGKVNISFNNYISNISNAKDIMLYRSHVMSNLYILTEDGNLYKYDTSNTSNNYSATKVDEYSNIVKIINYHTNKANAGGCSYLVAIDNNDNYYNVESSCV